MTTLFSYCIPYDDGAAPNPFWGVCTLAICKPRIRQAANVGDRVVATGSRNSPIGDIANKIVYAMLVTQKMTMEDYDLFTRSELRSKIPKWNSKDLRKCVGDSIYDFSKDPPCLRKSVHIEENRATDLSGGWVLLSDHFFYFGDKPIDLPQEILGIVKQGQGHRSNSNAPYFNKFVQWIHSLGYPPGSLIGKPQMWQNVEVPLGACATGRRQESEADLAEPEAPSRKRC
jgi:hypothetical protein